MEKVFDQLTGCGAPECWLKYTTNIICVNGGEVSGHSMKGSSCGTACDYWVRESAKKRGRKEAEKDRERKREERERDIVKYRERGIEREVCVCEYVCLSWRNVEKNGKTRLHWEPRKKEGMQKLKKKFK